jgi:hypothetical protein
LKDLCRYKGVEIIESQMMADHVHMLVSIPPKINVSSFMGYLKGKSALMIFGKHANLKYKFGNRHFWAEGYYVSTVGLNEATIKKYEVYRRTEEARHCFGQAKHTGQRRPLQGWQVIRTSLERRAKVIRAEGFERSESQRLKTLAGNRGL